MSIIIYLNDPKRKLRHYAITKTSVSYLSIYLAFLWYKRVKDIMCTNLYLGCSWFFDHLSMQQSMLNSFMPNYHTFSSGAVISKSTKMTDLCRKWLIFCDDFTTVFVNHLPIHLKPPTLHCTNLAISPFT